MKFVPVPGVVLVEPIKDDTVIQTTGRDYTNAARIVTIREKDFLREYGYAEGDIIFYDEYSYRRFEHEGKEIFAVDTRGEGVWIIGKPEQDERQQTESMQTEGVLASVQTGPGTGKWDVRSVPTVQQ